MLAFIFEYLIENEELKKVFWFESWYLICVNEKTLTVGVEILQKLTIFRGIKRNLYGIRNICGFG